MAHVIAKSGIPISVSLATILVFLNHNRHRESIYQRDLATELGINAVALVHVLDLGAELGFLERQESGKDRRFNTLHILPSGVYLAEKIEAETDKLMLGLMHDVTLEEVETAINVLQLIKENANQYLLQTTNDSYL